MFSCWTVRVGVLRYCRWRCFKKKKIKFHSNIHEYKTTISAPQSHPVRTESAWTRLVCNILRHAFTPCCTQKPVEHLLRTKHDETSQRLLKPKPLGRRGGAEQLGVGLGTLKKGSSCFAWQVVIVDVTVV